MDKTPIHISSNIKCLIAQKGMRLAALAKLAGLSPNCVYQLVDNNSCGVVTAWKLAKALDVTIEQLCFTDLNPNGTANQEEHGLQPEGTVS